MLFKRDLDQKTVLITGASSGIGEALAHEFASRGANLVLAARREEKLSRVAEKVRAMGGKALVVRCDVTSCPDVEQAVAQALQAYGRLDVVVANAGFAVTGGFERMRPEDFRRQFETNVFGVLHTVSSVLPELKKTRGALALMGSVCGHSSFPGASAYSMSKFAVRALAEALGAELAPKGVSVTLISPGFVESEIRLLDNEGKPREGARDTAPSWMVMPADRAARQIIGAIARGKREVIVTNHAKLTILMQRLFPGLIRYLSRFIAARAR